MKILLIDIDGLSLSVVLRMSQAGHDVRWFVKPSKDRPLLTGKGFKGVNKINNWISSARWADLIIPLGNSEYLKKLDELRNMGFPVFGPSFASAQLEINRAAGMKLMEKYGFDVVPYTQFKSMKDAYNHVKKTEQRYVFKTLGDNEDKSLTYCSKHAADMMQWLECRMKDTHIKGAVMLQEFVEGIELGVSRWMGRKGFVGPWNESFEHKKLMPGNFGPATGEMGTVAAYTKESKIGTETLSKMEDEFVKLGHTGDTAIGFIISEDGKAHPTELTCYDKETEVLTERGWKLIKDVIIGESVATLNPESDSIEYRHVTNTIVKKFTGDMIHFKGLRLTDIMVTPDHDMWVNKENRGEWKLLPAKDVVSYGGGWGIKCSANWVGEAVETFTLPGYTEIHQLNVIGGTMNIEHPPITMPMEVWLKFIGLYISEGSIGSKCDKGIGYIVNIAQYDYVEQVAEYLKNFPIKVKLTKNGFQINSRQLCLYLHGLNLGKSPTKHVPESLMHLHTDQLAILLNSLMLGDGTKHKRSGHRSYITTSEKLAGQVQELMLKTGSTGRIVKSYKKGTIMSVNGGKEYIRNSDLYVINERRKNKDSWVDKRQVNYVPYNDYVYCLDVPPHHLLYVRRNGNASWCGNCRTGFPENLLMLSANKGDPADWMKDSLAGKDTTSFSEDIGTCVVMAQPPFPGHNDDLEKTTGVPLYGVTRGNKKHIHPLDIKVDMMNDMEGDHVVKHPMWNTTGEYVAVVTGFGKDVKQSTERVYKTVGQLHLANMIVRDDVGEKLKETLPKLHAMGYATHFNYE